MENKNDNNYLKEITEDEIRKLKPQRTSTSIQIIEKFLDSNMNIAEVNLLKLPQPSRKKDSRVKSTKQDSFASSFYSWKKKRSTQDKLEHLELNILLIRRGKRIILKKKQTSN